MRVLHKWPLLNFREAYVTVLNEFPESLSAHRTMWARNNKNLKVIIYFVKLMHVLAPFVKVGTMTHIVSC